MNIGERGADEHLFCRRRARRWRMACMSQSRLRENDGLHQNAIKNKIPRSDTDEVGENEVAATSELHANAEKAKKLKR